MKNTVWLQNSLFSFEMSRYIILLSNYLYWRMSGSVISRFIRRLQHGQLMWPQWHWKNSVLNHARFETDVDHFDITWASNSDEAFDSPAKLSYLDSLQDSGEDYFLQQKNFRKYQNFRGPISNTKHEILVHSECGNKLLATFN